MREEICSTVTGEHMSYPSGRLTVFFLTDGSIEIRRNSAETFAGGLELLLQGMGLKAETNRLQPTFDIAELTRRDREKRSKQLCS